MQIKESSSLPADWLQIADLIAAEVREHPGDYLRQFAISKTMHPMSRPLTPRYWHELQQNSYFREVLLPLAEDRGPGSPFEFVQHPAISPQSVQHCYYLALMRQHGIEAENLSVAEVGGGYGNLARILRKMGHTKRYQIADLPQIHELQNRYLTETIGEHGVEFVTLDGLAEADLLIGTFSISEMSDADRDTVERKYGDSRLFLAYTIAWGDYDNIPYFAALHKRIGGKHFKDRHRSTWYIVR